LVAPNGGDLADRVRFGGLSFAAGEARGGDHGTKNPCTEHLTRRHLSSSDHSDCRGGIGRKVTDSAAGLSSEKPRIDVRENRVPGFHCSDFRLLERPLGERAIEAAEALQV